jgi:hypothetical protein
VTSFLHSLQVVRYEQDVWKCRSSAEAITLSPHSHVTSLCSVCAKRTHTRAGSVHHADADAQAEQQHEIELHMSAAQSRARKQALSRKTRAAVHPNADCDANGRTLLCSEMASFLTSLLHATSLQRM